MTTVWRGHITFALISIPVRLFRAARAERVKLRQLYRIERETGPKTNLSGRLEPEDEPVAPVRQVAARLMKDEVVPRHTLIKGFEFEKDRFVTIDQAELKAIAPQTSTEMDIQEFVKLAQIDPIYFEASYLYTSARRYARSRNSGPTRAWSAAKNWTWPARWSQTCPRTLIPRNTATRTGKSSKP